MTRYISHPAFSTFEEKIRALLLPDFGDLAVKLEQGRYCRRLAPSEAALGRNAEGSDKLLRDRHAVLRTGLAVAGMNQYEIDFGARRHVQARQGRIVLGVFPLARHRQLKISERPRRRLQNRIDECHRRRRVLRLDDVLVPRVSVAEMDADLGAALDHGDLPGDPLDRSRQNILEMQVVSAVIADELEADIPLYRQVVMGDGPVDRFELL